MPVKPAFKRLETDAELRGRIILDLDPSHVAGWLYDLNGARGEKLDNLAWAFWKKQRRILEIFP
jgi:hypothetical protein